MYLLMDERGYYRIDSAVKPNVRSNADFKIGVVVVFPYLACGEIAVTTPCLRNRNNDFWQFVIKVFSIGDFLGVF